MAIALVTGATAQLGIHLLPRLAQRYSIRCMLRSEEHQTALRAAIPGLPFEFVLGTPSDADVLDRALRGCDVVVNLLHEPFGSASAERTWKTNELYTECLARRARALEVGRFLHVSTALALGGSPSARVLSESDCLDLPNLTRLRLPWAASRRRGEEKVLEEASQGLDAVIVNPGCPAGAVSPLAAALTRSAPRWLPSGGLNVVDVERVADGCMRALESGRTGHRYILGGANLTGPTLVQELTAALDLPAPRRVLHPVAARGLALYARLRDALREPEPAQSAEVLRMFPLFFWYSSQKAIDELGYSVAPYPEPVVPQRPAAAKNGTARHRDTAASQPQA